MNSRLGSDSTLNHPASCERSTGGKLSCIMATPDSSTFVELYRK